MKESRRKRRESKGRFERIENTLDEILETVRRIDERTESMAVDQAALDQAVADLGTHADALDKAVADLIAKIEASPVAADFTAEVQALQTASGNLQSATDAANAALNPPAPGA